MATEVMPAPPNNGGASARDLFALTDEQILQIEPDAQDVEVFGAERSDPMDPLREDIALLTSASENGRPGVGAEEHSKQQKSQDGLKAVATTANTNAQTSPATGAVGDASGEAPHWLVERMNDPQHGAAARELWQGVQAARQEASAFREVFSKPEDARAAADRAHKLDEIDRAYFGAAGSAPELISASRAQLAAQMLREDPAAFREMVFAGLRALENAGHAGNESVAAPFRAASSGAAAPSAEAPRGQVSPSPPLVQESGQAPHQQVTQHPHSTSRPNEAYAQEARLAAYAAFERAANEELESGVGSAIQRSLQQALPNASRSENGAALRQRLSAAVRQDVEKALQGDRALGEQVARILSGQRLDHAARAQVVRLIGERAQQLVPGATRRVLADWTQTTLAAHGAHNEQEPASARRRDGELAASVTVDRSAAPVAQKNITDANTTSHAARRQTSRDPSSRDTISGRSSRRIDYRRISDEDILNS